MSKYYITDYVEELEQFRQTYHPDLTMEELKSEYFVEITELNVAIAKQRQHIGHSNVLVSISGGGRQ